MIGARYHGDRSALIRRLDEAGVQTNIYYLVPLHLQEANRFLGLGPGTLPIAERLCDEVIALPMYAELTTADQDRVIETIATPARHGP